MNNQLSLHNIIQINDKKYNLSKLLQFKNKPIEKYLKLSVERETVIYHLWINIDYNNLENFFYQHSGITFNFDKTEILYFEQKIKKCINCNLDKKYILYELTQIAS